MTAGQTALDDAIKRCEFLQGLLRKKTTKQVWTDEERSTIKATCQAWFNNQSPAISPELELTALVTANAIYDRMLKASERAGSRSKYQDDLKELHGELLEIRSKQMAVASKIVATSDVAPSFAQLIPDARMQGILNRR